MIKSIVVSKRPIEFTIGAVYYTGSLDWCQKHEVVTEPFKDPESDWTTWKVGVITTEVGRRLNNNPHLPARSPRQDFLYLGDEGIPGYAYDDRPCCIARSPLCADIQAKVRAAWLAQLKAKRDLQYQWED